MELRRRAYLQAMGIDIWVSRRHPSTAGGLVLLGVGPGQASTVLLCAAASESDTVIGRDLARTIEGLQGQAPMWAWLDPAPGDNCLDLPQLIDDRLITRVLVLGAALGDRLAAGSLPRAIGSAAILSLPGLGELAVNRAARQRAWTQLRDGLCGPGRNKLA